MPKSTSTAFSRPGRLSLVVAAIGMVLATRAASAGTSAVVSLSGVVPARVAVRTARTLEASALPLAAPADTRAQVVRVADVSIGTSAAAGLTITAQGGELRAASGASIPLQVRLQDASEAAPTPAAFALPADEVSADAGEGEIARDLYVHYLAMADAPAGRYSGTVRLTIEDN
jgi:hypothetical protein